MKHSLLRTTALLLGLGLAHLVLAKTPPACPPEARTPTAAEAGQAEQQARDRGFLWHATKDGRSAWLYGTIHVGDYARSLPGPTVAAAMHQADLLALEIDMTEPEVQRRLMKALQSATMPAPLPAALARRLQRQVAVACLPPEMASRMPPPLLIDSLGTLAGRRDGLDPAFGVDATLATRAHAAGLPVQSLESPESQVELLSGGSAEEQVADVAEGLTELESGEARRLLRRVADVWNASRLSELENYAGWCGCLRTPGERRQMTRLLDDRNRGMSIAIEALHDAGRQPFVAVGSLHMIGPLGLPALLEQRGWQVDRLIPR